MQENMQAFLVDFIAILKDYEEAVVLDRANRNTLWQDVIKKEMSKVEVAFHFNQYGSIPVGFQKIACHIVYDVKFDSTRKARYVGGGHMASVPAAQSYSSVVSRDSVRIMFLIAALNDLDIKMCDIGNTYLNAETRDHVYFISGPEWGSRAGLPLTIVRALYGLKSSRAGWKKSFASYIRHEPPGCNMQLSPLSRLQYAT
ncbi:pol protein [Chaetoceros tenuissimus]|uniref:Pol protein n=1 Tax=Chaetoceros tenuissimus TaxID=426638 RepID=A0AAD3HAP6_9STRA|nr:pol protein [Chaetoceros tenuissimus]